MDLKPLYDVNSERQTSHDLSHMWILVFSVCVHVHVCVCMCLSVTMDVNMHKL